MNLSIREERMSDFFCKHHVDGLPFPAVFHEFSAPDEGDPHDHPWGFESYVLSGGYVERVYRVGNDGQWDSWIKFRHTGDVFYINRDHIHRIVSLIDPKNGCVTLIKPFTDEPKTPGFYQFRDDGVYRRDWNVSAFTKINGERK